MLSSKFYLNIILKDVWLIINGSKKNMIFIDRSFYVSDVPKNRYICFSAAVLLSRPIMKNDFEGWFESYTKHLQR